MNEKTRKVIQPEKTEKNEINTALDMMANKKKPDETQKEAPKITVGHVKSYKEHEIAVSINNFLSKNLDEQSGDYLVGENAARCLEHYGLKGHPILGLVIAVIMVTVHVFMEMLKKEKKDKNEKQKPANLVG